MVGAGIFRAASTERDEEGVMPRRAHWLKGAVAAFAPETNEVILDNGERVAYRALVAAPGIKLDWSAVEGLPETLGKNAVTSNYRFDLAPYTWRLVESFVADARSSRNPLPIKCNGAPQRRFIFPAIIGSGTVIQGQPSSFTARAACFSASRMRPGADGIYQEIWRGAQFQ